MTGQDTGTDDSDAAGATSCSRNVAAVTDVPAVFTVTAVLAVTPVSRRAALGFRVLGF